MTWHNVVLIYPIAMLSNLIEVGTPSIALPQLQILIRNWSIDVLLQNIILMVVNMHEKNIFGLYTFF